MHDYDLLIAPLISLLSMAVGAIVYLNNKKESAGKVVAIISISIGFWVLSAFFSDVTKNEHLSLLLNRFTFVSLFFFLGSLLYLPFVFPLKSNYASMIKLPLIIFSLLSGIVTLFSPFIIAQIHFESWGSNVTYGKYFSIFIAYTIVAMLTLLVKFIITYIRLKDRVERSKIRLFFIGLLLVTAINIIVQVIIRGIVGSDEFYRFGNYSVIIFVGCTAYAIVRNQLFNIKVIVTEVGVAIVNIAILEQIFLPRTSWQIYVNILLFIIVAYGSKLLIHSVIQEIKQKEELQILAKKLDKANVDLEELDEAKDNFLSMASHELNTPIAAIEGYLSMIIEEKSCGNLSPQLKKYLTNVFLSSQRLAGLVKDLLNVSRIESNRIHLIYTEVQIEDIIDQSIAEVKIKADEVGHKLIFEKPKSKLPKTYIDAPRIIEVIINIIGNAIKYTDPPGKIVVACHADDGKIVISVDDNGRGIPKDKFDHVFEKFTQVNVLTDQIKGTGLGMFISKNLIEMHKGKLWFTSSVDEKDHGTTFYFSLPILKTKPFDPHEGEGALFQTGQKTTNSITEAEQKAAEEKAEKIPDIVKIQEPTQERKTNPPAGGQDSEKTAIKEAEELEPEPGTKPEDKPSNKPPEKQAVDIKSQSL